ncbi:MAG: Tetratricopeptide repeat, partial [Steroidobacteraceae bacterium]|nr:Tetratricopeptide repeat [Steroidobacteraceae bacterium]
MTRRISLALMLGPVLVAGCADRPAKHTLAELRHVQPDVQEVQVEEGWDTAMAGYRRFLEETPETAM